MNKIFRLDKNEGNYYVKNNRRKRNLFASFPISYLHYGSRRGKISKFTVLNVPKSLINWNTVQSTANTGLIQSIFLEKYYFLSKAVSQIFFRTKSTYIQGVLELLDHLLITDSWDHLKMIFPQQKCQERSSFFVNSQFFHHIFL